MTRHQWICAVGLLVVVGSILAGCGMPGVIASSGTLRPAGPLPTPTPLAPVAFPADEAPHHDLTEWWYYTGHLAGHDAAGRSHEYGFELTFFQTRRGAFPPYDAAHYAISDVTRGEFHYDQRAGFVPSTSQSDQQLATGFQITLGGWSAQGANGQDRLHAEMASYTLDAALGAQKPLVLHGGNGIITYGQAGFSYYYSRTRMAVSGTMEDHGQPVRVTGQAWMDHQWGNFVSLAGSGWDWYSIQLGNNTEYMLYVIRDAQKRPLSTFGTFVDPEGTASEIPPTDIQTQPLGMWTSPHTGGVYPSGWRITILGSAPATLVLTPLLKDQELVTAQSTGVAYWEGAVRIQGSAHGVPVLGEGYVELTGYASITPNGQTVSIP